MKTLIYHIYPIAFSDPYDKCSALAKIKDFLPNICELGVNYLWLSPIFRTSMYDHGYDVSDYMATDPRFGSEKEFDELVEAASQYGMKVMMDLVLNHSSIYHDWFRKNQSYYYWREDAPKGWNNLFDGESAWEYDEERRKFYMHLFCKQQADLNWFPNGPEHPINQALVQEFRNVVDFWKNRGVAGSRLDALQCINKDASADFFDPMATTKGKLTNLAAEVIREVFNEDRKDLYLLAECLDLSGELIKFLHENTPINALMDNTPINTLKLTADQSATSIDLKRYIETVKKAAESCPGYSHATETHDGPRFTTAMGLTGREALDILFGIYEGKNFFSPDTIIIYQGQELGLKNPEKSELPDELMLELDADTALRHKQGASLDELRPTSRANARVQLPMSEYLAQINDSDSCFNHCRSLLNDWRRK